VRDAAVVVCPYRDASQSGVVLSAYAFQVPVVATTAGGLPEYVFPGKTGLLVPPGDASALVVAIKSLVTAPHLQENMGRSGRQRAEALYGLPVILAQTDTVISAVLNR